MGAASRSPVCSAEAELPMSKTRLEAFSDGVLAIIITILDWN
jgi:uncharacterized membrane protein